MSTKKLRRAVRNNDLTELRGMIETGIDLNASNPSDGDTVLHLAVKSGNPDVLQLLLEHQCDPNRKNNRGETPFHAALEEFHDTQCIQMLASYAADVHILDGKLRSPLHIAIQRRKLDIITTLIQHGADVNDDSNGEAPLHLALTNRCDSEIIHFLVASGANVSKVESEYGLTPLHEAVRQKYSRQTHQLLVDYGADVNAADCTQTTPLHLALRTRQSNTSMFLIEVGADINFLDSRLQSPLHLALLNCCGVNVIQRLVDAGADVNARLKSGVTPFHEAIRQRYSLCVLQMLLPSPQAATTVYAYDDFGRLLNSALSLHGRDSTMSHVDIIKLLIDNHLIALAEQHFLSGNTFRIPAINFAAIQTLIQNNIAAHFDV